MALPDETLVYCGHEYTMSNIRFAKTVEPDNVALVEREARRRAPARRKPADAALDDSSRKGNQPFVAREPAGSGSRRQTSTSANASADPASVFAALRKWKNEF